ncbi:MAG: hypothetical protein UY20_C0001G0018 [Candidatus Yanofskybacteria bacterium GW2011_GWA1_48_10]|uniref:Uncharacterized protein n=2 Tax=Candidatus Yanofskyibacteriota TaxID=1752733 RepID=A0A0G1U7U2_9BACT|nr:MAG: hypothetical protein UY20_C0001G0018 [Candidatus Yanofskybacteria bacterium GW2011_GWA1_48_10]OGN06587.1 MAG: hypothetical protein A2669_03010 [Candidatus Yanofskybacteria bacterium RIFCSPHIGHO2_01_FULL_48_25b]
MSYKKKKFKKSRLNQLRYKAGLVKTALLKAVSALFQRTSEMRLKQTVKLLEFLRQQSRFVRLNNKKIDEWVDGYVDDCILNGRPVEILTQWCISKDLEQRYQAQGQKFRATIAEAELFRKEIPRVIEKFKENGVAVNWWITLNRSYLDSGRISVAVENEYRALIEELIRENKLNDVTIFNWEDDVLGKRPEPEAQVMTRIEDFISKSAFDLELARHSAWAREEAGLIQTDSELERDVRFQIACEVEEGRFLVSSESPFPNGKFILVPLEVPERYIFFSVMAPDFQKRITPILKSYPWRVGP